MFNLKTIKIIDKDVKDSTLTVLRTFFIVTMVLGIIYEVIRRPDGCSVTMTSYAFRIWLTVVASFTFGLISFLWGINVVSYHRHLRKLAIPQPFRTQFRKLTIGRFITNLFLSGISTDYSLLLGRRFFINWDIRWVAAGENLGKIVQLLEDDKLMLEFDKPIQLGSDVYNQAVFLPAERNKSVNKYLNSAVKGKLLLGGAYEDTPAWSEIVVYK